MSMRALSRPAQITLLFVVALACDKKEVPTAEDARVRVATPTASTREEPSDSIPAGCKAGSQPAELGSILGDVYGFGADVTSLYATSWQLYGNRGDLTRVRKDGGGARALASLDLEPRGLAVDLESVLFTSGIRLMRASKQGGAPEVVAATFSAQAIAIQGDLVYGVPGDYGPYDRVAKVPKKGGDAEEVGGGSRPSVKERPVGYSAVAVDASGVYVTDSGGDRVLAFPLDKGKPKALAAHQPKAFGLALDKSNAYFTLALKGELLRVPKSGGAPAKLASGLVKNALVAADDRGAFTVLAGDNENAPVKIAKVVDTTVTPVATLQPKRTVEAIAVDEKCVYWVERDADSRKSLVMALGR